MTHKILDAVEAVSDGDEFVCQNPTDQSGIWQTSVEGVGAFTVVLQGKCSSDPQCEWTDIHTHTTEGANVVAVFPFMRAQVTALDPDTIVHSWLVT